LLACLLAHSQVKDNLVLRIIHLIDEIIVTTKIWNLNTSECLRTIGTQSNDFRMGYLLKVNKNSLMTIRTRGKKNSIKIWNIKNRENKKAFEGHDKCVLHIDLF